MVALGKYLMTKCCALSHQPTSNMCLRIRITLSWLIISVECENCSLRSENNIYSPTTDNGRLCVDINNKYYKSHGLFTTLAIHCNVPDCTETIYKIVFVSSNHIRIQSNPFQRCLGMDSINSHSGAFHHVGSAASDHQHAAHQIFPKTDFLLLQNSILCSCRRISLNTQCHYWSVFHLADTSI